MIVLLIYLVIHGIRNDADHSSAHAADLWLRMAELLVNNELEGMWKETVKPHLRHYPKLCIRHG